jgi:hypothetical protein
MVGNYDFAKCTEIVQHCSPTPAQAAVSDCGYGARLRQAPRMRPLIANPSKGRPMSMQISGHGFVSKAENTEMVAYSMNKNANQQARAILRPQNALVAFNREISIANV